MTDLLRDHVVAAVGDRYALEEEIGRGAAGVVYRATEVRLRRPVALKVLPPDLAFRPGVRERFLREAQTAAQLSHAYIVPVYAAGDERGVAWLAMALVDGETLAARLSRAPRVPLAEARRILAETADALAYAHARGVVHRDVKPENILLDRESGRVQVADFGIARAAEDDARLTGTGVTLGTPAYMSPEQAMGESAVDGRSDQYALGVIGYQLLTGTLPFQATSATGMLMKHVGEAPRAIRERAPEVPAALAAAVERALAKRPGDRWPDAGAFRDALRAAPVGPLNVVPNAPDPFGATRGAPNGAPPAFPAARLGVRPAWMPPRPPEPPGADLYGADPFARAEAEFERYRGDRGGRAAREEWREYERAQRQEARDRRREWREAVREGLAPNGLVPVAPVGGLAAPGAGAPARPVYPEIPLDARIALFRRKAVGAFVLIAFLTIVNAIHAFIPPWVVFPAWGLAADLRRRWRPLGAAGLSFSDVMLRGAAARVPGATLTAGQIRHSVRRLRTRAQFTLAMAVMAAALLVAAAVSHGAGPVVGFLVVFSVLTLFGGIRSAAAARRVAEGPVSLRDALSGRWREAVEAATPLPPHAQAVDAEVRALAARGAVANGMLPLLREAVDDRVTVRETLAKLSPEDRALLPVADVMPTVDGLVERIADLAGRLERFPADASPAALAALDARLAGPAGAGADAVRTRQLLERQRASLADLVERRAGLEAKLESARVALRTVRFDLLKLRDEGVGALAGVSSATQEARALSRDIGHALAAAAEVRGR